MLKKQARITFFGGYALSLLVLFQYNARGSKSFPLSIEKLS